MLLSIKGKPLDVPSRFRSSWYYYVSKNKIDDGLVLLDSFFVDDLPAGIARHPLVIAKEEQRFSIAVGPNT